MSPLADTIVYGLFCIVATVAAGAAAFGMYRLSPPKWKAAILHPALVLRAPFAKALPLSNPNPWKVSRALFSAEAFLAVSAVVIIAGFILARLPWLLDFRIPFIMYDTGSYFGPVKDAFDGRWPIFSSRSPGYPFFIYVSFLLCPKLTFIMALQCLLSLVSSLFLLYVIYRTCGRLVLLACVPLLAHATQPLLWQHDFAILTESLFTSMFLFFLGLLLLGMRKPRPLSLALCSVVGGYATLVRMGGIFILGCIILGCVHLLARRAGVKGILSLAVPAPAMILALMAYNHFTFGAFAISSLDKLTRWGISCPYWETDPSFPPEVNRAIEEFHDKMPEADRRIVMDTWELDRMQVLFAKWGGYAVHLWPGKGGMDKMPEYYGMVASKAVRSHPGAALKFFLSTYKCFLEDASSYRMNLYCNADTVAHQMYVEGTATVYPFVSREFATMPDIRTLAIVKRGDGSPRVEIVNANLRGRGLHHLMLRIGMLLFDGRWMLYSYLVVAALSLVKALRTRFAHWGAMALCVICASHLGAGAVVALTTTMTNRYPSPTRFLELMAPFMIPLLWTKLKPVDEIARKEAAP